MSIQFVDGLKASRAQVQQCSADSLAERVVRSYGRSQLYEWYAADGYGKPVFDVDGSSQTETAETLLQRAMAGVDAFFGQRPSRVVVSQSHGRPGDAYPHKLSYRLYVPGYRMRIGDMKKRLQRLGLDKGQPFDAAIYGANQKLRMTGSIKSDEDRRLLALVDGPVTTESISDTIVQMVEPSWPLLEESDQQQITHQRKQSGVEETMWKDLEQHLEAHGFENLKYVGVRPQSITFSCSRSKPCLCCGLQHDNNNWHGSLGDDGLWRVKNYSDRCHYKVLREVQRQVGTYAANDSICTGLKLLGIESTPVQHSDCWTVMHHLATCPTCKDRHVSNRWIVESVVRQQYTVRNEEVTCQRRLLGAGILECTNPHLYQIYENPKADTEFAHLYTEEQGHNYICDDDGRMYMFEDGRWRRKCDFELINDVESWLTKLFDLLFKCLAVEDSMGSSNIKRVDDIRKQMRKAHNYIQHENTLRNSIVKTVKRKCYTREAADKWDSRGDLLAFDNGVLELETGLFRAAQKEDYLRMSVGYQYLHDYQLDPLVQTEVEQFIQSIYPVQEEREMFQRFAGYCLLGRHNEKLMLLLTDKRDGFNGKSTMLSLMARTMGDYATRAPACVLYKQDKASSVNEHSAGMLSFRYKRFMYIEETDSSKALDNELVKDLNGGRAVQSGRALYGSAIQEFEWITKMIMACNDGKTPHLDLEDAALMERIVVVPHRSRFYTGEVPDDPFSFPADTCVKDRFDRWRPYFLKWMVDGLHGYQQNRFAQIPEACRSFKENILSSKDVIGSFIADTVEQGGAGDYVKLRDLYKRFDEQHRSMQRDKKTFKSFDAFQKGVVRVLNGATVKEVYQFMEYGKKKKARNVIIGHRLML